MAWNSVSIQAKKGYDVAVKHGKAIVITEPVKGGSLACLPQAAEENLRNLCPEESIASWAIRFATDLEKLEVVLSGMNTMEQMEDNMQDLTLLTASEREVLEQCAGDHSLQYRSSLYRLRLLCLQLSDAHSHPSVFFVVQ